MNDQKKKQTQNLAKQNVVESLKGIGNQASKDFFDQLLGLRTFPKNASGELSAGETLSMNEALGGKVEENKKLRAQILLERNLAADEARLSEEKIGKLRVQLQALISEIAKIAVGTQSLAKEVNIAVLQVPVEPGIYHINFFEKLLSFAQSFRNKIEEAAVWLGATNKLAEKKNYWSTYKKKGSSFLLAPDHYLQRSAG